MFSKQSAFKLKSDLFKALAHPVRLAVIEQLRTGESSVGGLVQKLKVEQSGLSKHLSILRLAGILKSRQEKVTVYYSLWDRDIFKILSPLTAILRKRLKENRNALAYFTAGVGVYFQNIEWVVEAL